MLLVFVYIGELEQAKSALQSWIDVSPSPPLANMVATMRYKAMQRFQDSMLPHGAGHYFDNLLVPLSSVEPDIGSMKSAVKDLMANRPAPNYLIALEPGFTGAMTDIPVTANAFYCREECLTMGMICTQPEAFTEEQLQECRSFMHEIRQKLSAVSAQEQYLNLVTDLAVVNVDALVKGSRSRFKHLRAAIDPSNCCTSYMLGVQVGQEEA
jgi:hypothetical protein